MTQANFGENGGDGTGIDLNDDEVDDFRRKTTITTSWSGHSKLTKVDVSIVYRYRQTWKTDIPITMTSVLVNME